MKLTIKRAALLKILSLAYEAVPVKSTEPAFVNYLIDISNENIEILASDGNITIKGVIPTTSDDVINSVPGKIQVPAKYLLDIMRKLEGEVVTISLIETSMLNIADDRSNFNLNTVAGEEYPDIDMNADAGEELEINGEDFKHLYDSTAFAVAVKGPKEVYYGVNINATDDKLMFTATDSYRLARRKINVSGNHHISFTVPVKALQLISHYEKLDKVKIKIDSHKALFFVDDLIISTRLYSGDFPNIDRIIPQVTPYRLSVDSKNFIKAIERVTIVSVEKQFIVRLLCENGHVEVSARSSSIGTSKEVLQNATFEGERFEINFNVQFVVDAIKALNTDRVSLAFAGESKAFLVQNGDPDNIQLITPIRSNSY